MAIGWGFCQFPLFLVLYRGLRFDPRDRCKRLSPQVVYNNKNYVKMYKSIPTVMLCLSQPIVFITILSNRHARP